MGSESIEHQLDFTTNSKNARAPSLGPRLPLFSEVSFWAVTNFSSYS